MNTFLSSFSIAFGLLFLTELGDKTQLIIISLALKDGSRGKLAIGATFGFLAIILVGGIFASLICHYIPLSLISQASGVIFILLGGYQLTKRITQGSESTGENEDFFRVLPRSNVIAGFLGIFIMELGDKTQVMTIFLATQSSSLFGTLCGAWVALSLLAFIGAFAGSLISKHLPRKKIKLVSALLFLIVGVVTIILG